MLLSISRAFVDLHRRDWFLLAIPVIASCSLFYVDTRVGFDLVAYAAFYAIVLLPAAVLSSRWMLASVRLSFFEQAILGYPAAVTIYSVVFYVLDVLDLRWVGYVLALIPLSLILVLRQHGEAVKTEIPVAVSVLIFYCMAVSLFFLLYSLTTVAPSLELPGLYYQDSLWTVGNTWSIIREGFPVPDARFNDANLSYHMAQNIYYAFAHQLTGIDPFNLHLRVAPIFDLFFLVGVIAVGSKRFLGMNRWEVMTLPLVVLFTAGASSWVVIGYLGHVYVNPLSTFFGLHAYLLLLMLVGYHSLSDRVFIVYTALVALLAFSTKASLALTLLPALAIYLLYRSFRGYRLTVRDVILAITLLVVVLVLRFTLYDSADGAMMLRDFAPLNASQIEKLSSLIGESAAQMAAPFGAVIKVTIDFIRAFASISLTLYVFGFALLWLTNKGWRDTLKMMQSYVVFVLALSISSALWITLFSFSDAEVYFIWYPVIAWGLIFGLAINYLLFRQSKYWFPVIAVILLGIGTVSFVEYASRLFYSPWWRVAVLGEIVWDDRATISLPEWKAMTWVKDSLPGDVVLISDRRGFRHEGNGEFKGRFFGYSALSGRQFFNEGDDFNKHAVNVYADNRWNLVEGLLKTDSETDARIFWDEIAADYFVVSKRFSIPGVGLKSTAVPVFENADVLILQRSPVATPST